MKKAIKLFTIVIGLLSCNSKKEVRMESNSTDGSKVINSPAKTFREEYWPLESETASIDTVVNSKNSYRIKIHTRSLNDSAALFKVTDEQGEILVHAHNRISEITIIRRDSSLIKSTLTRDLFKGRDELDELRLMYWTNFLRLEKNEFIFSVGACVPDSDVCDEAEIAIDEKGLVRVVKFIEELEELEE